MFVKATKKAATPGRLMLTEIHTPLSWITLEGCPNGLTRIHLGRRMTDCRGRPMDTAAARVHPVMGPALKQIGEYLQGRRRRFFIPVCPEGTPFQLRVWQTMTTIPYGATVSYGKLAARLGSKKLARAVGQAAGRNPLPLIIPCHRVIGADGSLTGFASGLHWKQWLLELEQGEGT